MHHALGPDGREYDVDGYRKQFGVSRAQKPCCPACSQAVTAEVHLKDPTKNHFRHLPRPEDKKWEDDCSLANREDRWGGMFRNSGPWRGERGKELRQQFLAPENREPLRNFFNHVMDLSHGRHLRQRQFDGMLAKADKKNVWGLDGMSMWMLPYVFLTLTEFENSAVRFEFYFDRKGQRQYQEMHRRGTYIDTGKKAYSGEALFPITQDYYEQHSQQPQPSHWAGPRPSTTARSPGTALKFSK